MHQRFDVFVRYIFCRISDLMEYAILDFCLWINGFDGLGKSRQVVGTRNQNIVYPTMFDAIEDGRPEFGALIFTHPTCLSNVYCAKAAFGHGSHFKARFTFHSSKCM